MQGYQAIRIDGCIKVEALVYHKQEDHIHSKAKESSKVKVFMKDFIDFLDRNSLFLKN